MAETANRVMVPGYRHVPGNHCGSTALRNLLGLPRGRDLRGDGVRAGRGRLLLLRGPRRAVAFSVHERPGRPARGELPGADRRPASLRTEADPEAPGSWPARPSTRAGRRSCSPTSTTWTTTAARPTSRATPSCCRVRRGARRVSDTAFEDLQTTSLESLPRRATRSSRSSRSRATRRSARREPARPRRPARRTPRRRSSGPPPDARAAARANSRGCRRCGASPPRSATGPRPPRTGSGAPASSTR